MVDSSFFDKGEEHSLVKSRIVAKYFASWANVIKGSAWRSGKRIDYIDLFAGPGRYEDGSDSTPLLVLKAALSDDQVAQMLVATFNDRDSENCHRLGKVIDALAGIEKLKHRPTILNVAVGSGVATTLSSQSLSPTLLFADPWGYKGLSLELFRSVLKDWACECVFFFNYRRINPALSNKAFSVHMDRMFGRSRAQGLKKRILGMKPIKRELAIMKELRDALKDMGGAHILTFRFLNHAGKRTRHFLVFVTKDPKGFMIMRDIMAKESSRSYQGVPAYEYCGGHLGDQVQLSLELSGPLDDLKELLMTDFAGKRVAMHEIYMEHSLDKLYIERNYKDALLRLEGEGRITTDPPAGNRPTRHGRVTFGPNVVVSFPPRRKK